MVLAGADEQAAADLEVADAEGIHAKYQTIDVTIARRATSDRASGTRFARSANGLKFS